MTEPRDVLAAALFETQHERLHGGADGMGLGSHEADADAILAAMPDHTLVSTAELERLRGVERTFRQVIGFGFTSLYHAPPAPAEDRPWLDLEPDIEVAGLRGIGPAPAEETK